MLFRSLLAALALTSVAPDSQAGPFRRRAQSTYQSSWQPAYRPSYQEVYGSPSYTPTTVTSDGVIITSPTPAPSAETVSGYTPLVTPAVNAAEIPTAGGGLDGDGLDEVNALRSARGLRPFIRDDGLTQAARGCAQFRAEHGLFGHSSNDFAFVPAGTFATAAGCAAYSAEHGWMSCCVYDNYTFGGAAWVTGRDGRRYMHLYVR